MEIYIARSAGFCFGVKRAINMADECAEDSKRPIATLGPIIHNPQVVKRLEKSGVYAKDDLKDINEGTVIVRSHGVRSEVFEEIKDKGLNMVDATCPFVTKAQALASLLSKEGYYVVVVGEHDHPEVIGIVSYVDGKIIVAASADELDELKGIERIGIIAQTTQSIDRLKEVTDKCLEIAQEVKVFNTICDATSIRQSESSELAKTVDAMIVIGGRNSGNTTRLREICTAIQPKTYHIEVADEIKDEWFKGLEKIGVTAGASTPSWIIENVVGKIEDITKGKVKEFAFESEEADAMEALM